MSRIFATLGMVALALLSITLFLGLTVGDYNGVSDEYRAQQRRDTPSAVESNVVQRLEVVQAKTGRHILFGVLAALVTVMVNSLAVTYFIGTGRWCREVSDTYELDPQLDRRANRLKKSTFPWSILGILTVLAVAALGAAADPGTLRETTGRWVLPHYYMAMIGVGIIAWAFFRQYEGIRENHAVIEDVMAAVRRIRTEKGLDVEPVAVP